MRDFDHATILIPSRADSQFPRSPLGTPGSLTPLLCHNIGRKAGCRLWVSLITPARLTRMKPSWRQIIHLIYNITTICGVSKFQFKVTRGLSYLIPGDNLTHFVLSLCSLYEQRDVNLDSRAFPVKSRLSGFWKPRLLRLAYKPEWFPDKAILQDKCNVNFVF